MGVPPWGSEKRSKFEIESENNLGTKTILKTVSLDEVT